VRTSGVRALGREGRNLSGFLCGVVRDIGKASAGSGQGGPPVLGARNVSTGQVPTVVQVMPDSISSSGRGRGGAGRGGKVPIGSSERVTELTLA
jgi:hypothetical protein